MSILPQKSGIYQIINTETGRCYIGSSKELEYRFKTHREELSRGCHHNTHLQRAWNLYGSLSFGFDVLEFCSEDHLLEREDWWINLTGSLTRSKGYNLISADRSFVSEETKEKMSIIRRGKRQTPETVDKRRASQVGKKRTEEMKERMRKPKSVEHSAAISYGKKGKKFSQEHIESMSAARLGKPWSEARRQAQNNRKFAST